MTDIFVSRITFLHHPWRATPISPDWGMDKILKDANFSDSQNPKPIFDALPEFKVSQARSKKVSKFPILL